MVLNHAQDILHRHVYGPLVYRSNFGPFSGLRLKFIDFLLADLKAALWLYATLIIFLSVNSHVECDSQPWRTALYIGHPYLVVAHTALTL